jgi:hypothetical protein
MCVQRWLGFTAPVSGVGRRFQVRRTHGGPDPEPDDDPHPASGSR